MIEDATVDAYGESEEATAFLTMLEEHLALPFDATVLGEAVAVEKIDLNDADELLAICRRGGKRQKLRLLDLELPASRPTGAEWIAAYRRWSRRR
ncbi:MAG: calcium-binding protein [Vicinamibacterales bacterium]